MRARLQMFFSVAVAGALFVACGSDETSSQRQLTVMTRNLYLGADLNVALTATTPDAFVAATTAIWNMVRKNDFNDRAKAVAAEIAAARPDLVALQEVALWRTQTPGDATTVLVPNATTVAYDFLELVRSELAARGVTYDVAEALELTDLEVPIANATGTGLDDVRFTDRDVILARRGVTVSNPQGHVYTNLLEVSVAGTTRAVKRGFTRATATFGGQQVTFVNTHLEAGDLAPISALRTAQATELVQALASETGRVVLAGDLNSAPGTEGHLAATGAGFADAWPVVHGADPGLTCCWPEDLAATSPGLSSRIDLVLTRGALHATSATIVGEEVADRTAGGRWPSDHAGLVATIQVD
jgi:endonuclease/exonuclease/phosphatase family metal-dependent hydrolase